MPGTITHLVIADKVLDYLDNGLIGNRGLFFAGTIAPDAVHAKSDYKTEYKKCSHLKQDIPDEDFYYERYYELFNSRIDEFIRLRIKPANTQIDIDIGYLVHLIVDDKFLLSVYRELIIELTKISIEENSELFLKYVSTIKRNTDIWLVNKYSNIERIRKELLNIEPFSMEGYLTEDELSANRKWALENCFNKKIYIESKFISFDRMSCFIDDISLKIAGQIKKILIISDLGCGNATESDFS